MWAVDSSSSKQPFETNQYCKKDKKLGDSGVLIYWEAEGGT